MEIPQNTYETAQFIAPLNSMQISAPFDQDFQSTMPQSTFSYSHTTTPNWRPQIVGPNDDLLRIAVESGITSFDSDNENLPWPEINLEQVDDFLLAEVLKLDDYGSDACGSTPDGLAAQLKHLSLSSGKTAALNEAFLKSKPSLKVNQLVRKKKPRFLLHLYILFDLPAEFTYETWFFT